MIHMLGVEDARRRTLAVLSVALVLGASSAALWRFVPSASCASLLPHGGIAAAHNGADSGFAVAMIAHHQAAIDMARAELRDGRNVQLRRLAQEIIVTQRQEIAVMRVAMEALGEHDASAAGALR